LELTVDIKISRDTNDIELGPDGDLQWITGAEAIAQHVWIRLRFFLGEWFLDEREGVPYWERILVANPDQVAITEAFRRTVAETPGIVSVEKCNVTIDRQTRKLAADIEATTSDGTTLTSEDFGVPFVLAA
jgi:hypothetical protein